MGWDGSMEDREEGMGGRKGGRKGGKARKEREGKGRKMG